MKQCFNKLQKYCIKEGGKWMRNMVNFNLGNEMQNVN